MHPEYGDSPTVLELCRSEQTTISWRFSFVLLNRIVDSTGQAGSHEEMPWLFQH
jgi:hypothetical protein